MQEVRNPKSVPVFLISGISRSFEFVSDFDIRISDFATLGGHTAASIRVAVGCCRTTTGL
jgi:hypothetical protein